MSKKLDPDFVQFVVDRMTYFETINGLLLNQLQIQQPELIQQFCAELRDLLNRKQNIRSNARLMLQELLQELDKPGSTGSKH